MDAAFLLTVGSFLLTVELFYLQSTSLAFLLTIGAFSLTVLFSFFTYSWSLFPYSGKVRLIRALRDCKQRSLTVSKKAPTVSKKASPLRYLFTPFFWRVCRKTIAPFNSLQWLASRCGTPPVFDHYGYPLFIENGQRGHGFVANRRLEDLVYVSHGSEWVERRARTPPKSLCSLSWSAGTLWKQR